MLKMTLGEAMTLTSFASHAAELLDRHEEEWDPISTAQLLALRERTIPILRRLDADNPGLLPLPRDGVAWRDRP